MKKTFAFMLGLAVLAGCSKVDSQTEGGNAITGDNGLVPITLGGLDIISKATTKSGPIENQAFTAGIAGWEAAAEPEYTSEPSTWNTTINIAETSRNVTWPENGQKYYNADNAIKTYLKAWYPAGNYDKGSKTVTFDNQDGDIDVLLAPVISGSKDDSAEKNLVFSHMTTQLIFNVLADKSLAADTKIKSIKIKDAQFPVAIDLKLDKDADGAVTYAAAPADWTVPGIDGSQTITATETKAGKAVMVKPIASKTFSVIIETNKTVYPEKTVTVSTDTVEAGRAYTITLTFRQADVILTASVTPWETGTGSADIM